MQATSGIENARACANVKHTHGSIVKIRDRQARGKKQVIDWKHSEEKKKNRQRREGNGGGGSGDDNADDRFVTANLKQRKQNISSSSSSVCSRKGLSFSFSIFFFYSPSMATTMTDTSPCTHSHKNEYRRDEMISVFFFVRMKNRVKQQGDLLRRLEGEEETDLGRVSQSDEDRWVE